MEIIIDRYILCDWRLLYDRWSRDDCCWDVNNVYLDIIQTEATDNKRWIFLCGPGLSFLCDIFNYHSGFEQLDKAKEYADSILIRMSKLKAFW